MKVLVIVARGLQAGALSFYGNAWIESPSLDALAAEGVVFDQHFADAADAAGVRRAWRTGRYHLGDAPSPSADDLIARLCERGVSTQLIVDISRPAPPEFAEGWDVVEKVEPREDETSLESTLYAARAALHDLAGRQDWLLWVDLATLLPPWETPEEFVKPYFDEPPPDEAEEAEEEGEPEPVEPLEPLDDVSEGTIDPDDDDLFLRMQGSHAAAVSYLDAGIGQLLEDLQSDGEEVVVIVTSDVGQALGEHGVVGPSAPHEEIVRVPLLVRLPGGAQAGRRVAGLTQAVDLAPTLAALFGTSLPSAHGRGLLPLIEGEAETLREYAVAVTRVAGRRSCCLRTPEWAFLLDEVGDLAASARRARLFVKPDDRWEVNDVAQHHLDLTEGLTATLDTFLAAADRPGELQAPPLPAASPTRSAELGARSAE